jgi:hypothetical protein
MRAEPLSAISQNIDPFCGQSIADFNCLTRLTLRDSSTAIARLLATEMLTKEPRKMVCHVINAVCRPVIMQIAHFNRLRATW